MPSDYKAIRDDNTTGYGPKAIHAFDSLLRDRYDKRTHFIYELLQNAEDALERRPANWQGSREVSFRLYQDRLEIRHSGEPFNEDDVGSICGVVESTKREGQIGRFGIGFKSVFAFADRPEIYSGDEHFAIESYVLPHAIQPESLDRDETLCIVRFRPHDERAFDEVRVALQGMDATTILFLRHVQTVNWEIEGELPGTISRLTVEEPEPWIRAVRLSYPAGRGAKTSEWLIFEENVTDGGREGHAEIAIQRGEDGEVMSTDSPLVVFFPTVVPTPFGFLVQGPYKTTPSRDNIVLDDPWNKALVLGTARLVIKALEWHRDQDTLDADLLEVLPLEPVPADDLFGPVFAQLTAAFQSKKLLPRWPAGYVSGEGARLARTQAIRELLSPQQLQAIYGASKPIHWITDAITQDRRWELWNFLQTHVGIPVATPENITTRIVGPFFRDQDNSWVRRAYEFWNGTPAEARRLADQEIVRLNDGRTIAPGTHGKPRAFLPSEVKTEFPTVASECCSSEASLAFLMKVGLSEPNKVDDAIINILPRYNGDHDVSDQQYFDDLHRLYDASRTDSRRQRDRLLDSLRTCPFVRAADHRGDRQWKAPTCVLLPSQLLEDLCRGVEGVWFADPRLFKEGPFRSLLENAGAAGGLPVIEEPGVAGNPPHEWDVLRDARREAGYEKNTGNHTIEDCDIPLLETLLPAISELPEDERSKRTELLWSALVDTVNDADFTSATYRWFFTQPRRASVRSTAIHRLQDAAWIPNGPGAFAQPETVVFEDLEWPHCAPLIDAIRFRPSSITTLAAELGFDIEALDILRDHGLTNTEAILRRLGLARESLEPFSDELEKGSADDAPNDEEELRGEPPESPGVLSQNEEERRKRSGKADKGAQSGTNRTFYSYVGTHQEVETDGDGETSHSRAQLEAAAITAILDEDKDLERPSKTNQPGFDLLARDIDGNECKWVEVKAVRAGWTSHPVTLSRAQFQWARTHGDDFWLYVVEFATDPDRRQVHKICDPVGKARSYSFDHGWSSVSDSGISS